ncbi:MAG: hypothetical protein IT327_07635 [Anaerolineae bacterium]|nr:hypothetical protein [Anaerolineae bacterium]
MTQIETKHIRTDGGTQARAGLNNEKVDEYKELLRESDGEWPFKDPLVVFYDGTDYWLADGFHRFHACWTGGRYAVEADVRQGTRREAQLYAAGANADHGLPRTADDKRRAVTLLLEDVEWGKWSDREIARRCKVSPTFVGNIRKELGTVHVDSSERVYTRNGEERVMDTAAIGSKPLPGHADMRKRLRQSLRDEIYAPYQVTGITDADLRQVLSRDWGLGGGSSGPEMTAVYKKGGSDPGFWYNNYHDSGKPTLSGRELIVWVREVLELPYPQKQTAVSQPALSPFYVGQMAQGPEIRDALERYLDGKINRDMFITRLAKREASGHAAAMEEAVKALGASEMFIWHQAMVLHDGLPKPSWERGETAVSAATLTPEQIEGLVTRAANDVIDDGALEDYAALYQGWLMDGPDDPDWHHLEARTAGIPHGLIADALRSCHRRVATDETAVPAADLLTKTAQLVAAAPAPRRADYIDPRLASLNTALDLVTRLTADTSLTVDIVGPLARALGFMEDAKKALTKRQQYIAWLRDYQDDDGRRWTDLSDNQTWHKNSPCFQAFAKAFPKEDFAKSALMDAKTQLEKETAVSQEVTDEQSN